MTNAQPIPMTPMLTRRKEREVVRRRRLSDLILDDFNRDCIALGNPFVSRLPYDDPRNLISKAFRIKV